jgi:hypothetical protein
MLARAHSWLDRHPPTGDAGLAAVPLAFSLSTLTSEGGTYATLIGYLGGAAFEHNPLKGLLLGLALAAALTVAGELTRHLRDRGGSSQCSA